MHVPFQKLMRSRKDRMIAGVAGGIGQYLALDPVIVRVSFLLLIFSGGIGLFLYPIFWIAMPLASSVPSGMISANSFHVPRRLDDTVEDASIQNHDDSRTVQAKEHVPMHRSWFVGAVLIILGLFSVFEQAMPGIAPFIAPIILIGIKNIPIKNDLKKFNSYV